MEDWQQWQIRADEIAASLGAELDALDRDFFAQSADPSFRAFWPRFRDLKERVRTAPAIKLEDKLELERRLRTLGNRAYKMQEAAYGQSGERKTGLLSQIEALRERAEPLDSPRALRDVRREFDAVRAEFDRDKGLMPSDRQAVWDAWREANQFVWQRLTELWSANEAYLRDILADARQQLEAGNANAARQGVGKFFESLRTHEAKQASINALKTEAEGIRRSADEAEQRRANERLVAAPSRSVPSIEVWRNELDRNRIAIARLRGEVDTLEQRFQNSGSILEQAMVRGDLVDKRQKLAELERTNRSLEQRIEGSQETPLISIG